MTNLWINGHSYSELHEQVVRSGAKLNAGSQKRELHIEHIVDMCDNGLAFEGALIVGAVAELVGILSENADGLVLRLLQLQKNLSYGLPDMISISICELGIFDRVISRELKEILGEVELEPAVIKDSLQERAGEVQQLLSRYPTYFTRIFETF